MKIFKKDMLSRRREFTNTSDGKMVVTNALTDVYKEISIMKELNHPNVIKVHEIIDDTSGTKIYMSKSYIVIDYCDRGALMDWDNSDHRFVAS